MTRRVLLRSCQVKDGLTYFDDPLLRESESALDGVGVEVDPASGRVSLWRYQSGRRVGPHVEHFFGIGDPVVVDGSAIKYEYEHPEAMLVDGRRFTGLVASLSGTDLVKLEEALDGLLTGNLIAWYRDGSVKELRTSELQSTDEGLLEVKRRELRAGRAMDNMTTSARVVLTLGHDDPNARTTVVPTTDQRAAVPIFRPFDHSDQRSFSAYCNVDFDRNDMIESLALVDPRFFPFLETHPVDSAPMEWLPTSLDELVQRGVGPRLHLRLSTATLTTLLDALGEQGLSAVTELEIETNLLEDLSGLQRLFEAPSLTQVALIEFEKEGVDRGIREICTDLKATRPNISISVDKRPFLPLERFWEEAESSISNGGMAPRGRW